MDVTQLLGAPYDSLLEAKVDKSPDELVVSKDNETFYIVSESDYRESLASAGFEVVVNVGE